MLREQLEDSGLVPSSTRSLLLHFDPDKLAGFAQIMRFFHWPKNLLIFIPLIAAHKILDFPLLFKTVIAFLCFSLCASGMYCLSDFLDAKADRTHPTKKFRPFAAGTISPSLGLSLAFFLLLVATLTSIFTLPFPFALVLISYALITLNYSLYFKKIAILDVIVLAGLYTLRLFAGGTAAHIPISNWLLAFSMFFFLSLAFVKRYVELHFLKESGQNSSPARSYRNTDLQWIGATGSTMGYLSIIVLANYLTSKDVAILYRHSNFLWLICPLLLYWITRIWLLAYRGNIQDDPVLTTLKDPVTYFMAFFTALILFVSS